MDRTEFLETLGAQLSGQMQDSKASAHVRYYRDYIDEQIRKGRTEDEVLAELGDPRLIAKTLLDTDSEANHGVYESSRNYGGEQGGSQSYGESGYGEAGYDSGRQGQVKHRSYHLDLTTWYGKAIVIAIAALVIIGLLFLIGTVLPVIIIAGLIISLISWIRRRL